MTILNDVQVFQPCEKYNIHLPGVFEPELSQSTTRASLLESLLPLFSPPFSLGTGLGGPESIKKAKSSASNNSVFGRFKS